MNKIVPQERRDRKERVREEEEERKLKNKVKGKSIQQCRLLCKMR